MAFLYLFLVCFALANACEEAEEIPSRCRCTDYRTMRCIFVEDACNKQEELVLTQSIEVLNIIGQICLPSRENIGGMYGRVFLFDDACKGLESCV